MAARHLTARAAVPASNMPSPWLWHIELFLQACLIGAVVAIRPRLPRWESWLVARFIFDLAQCLLERAGRADLALNVWYAGVVVGCPLLFMALDEARPRGEWEHGAILHSWIALNMAAAWLRFFPVTGQVVLLIDSAAWVSWIWLFVATRERL